MTTTLKKGKEFNCFQSSEENYSKLFKYHIVLMKVVYLDIFAAFDTVSSFSSHLLLFYFNDKFRMNSQAM